MQRPAPPARHRGKALGWPDWCQTNCRLLARVGHRWAGDLARLAQIGDLLGCCGIPGCGSYPGAARQDRQQDRQTNSTPYFPNSHCAERAVNFTVLLLSLELNNNTNNVNLE